MPQHADIAIIGAGNCGRPCKAGIRFAAETNLDLALRIILLDGASKQLGQKFSCLRGGWAS